MTVNMERRREACFSPEAPVARTALLSRMITDYEAAMALTNAPLETYLRAELVHQQVRYLAGLRPTLLLSLGEVLYLTLEDCPHPTYMSKMM